MYEIVVTAYVSYNLDAIEGGAPVAAIAAARDFHLEVGLCQTKWAAVKICCSELYELMRV